MLLNCHSFHSLRYGTIPLSELVGLGAQQRVPALALTDINTVTGKTDFSFPGALKEQAKPTEAHKTQAAVNSDGKTNEATKNIKETLEPKQQAPKDKKQQEQQEKPQAPAKSKGRKM